MTSIINRSPTEVRRGQVLAEDPLVVRPELVHVGGVLGQHGLRRRTRLLVHLVQGLRPGEHLPVGAALEGRVRAVGVPAALTLPNPYLSPTSPPGYAKPDRSKGKGKDKVKGGGTTR